MRRYRLAVRVPAVGFSPCALPNRRDTPLGKVKRQIADEHGSTKKNS
jgi:hypothetical protein